MRFSHQIVTRFGARIDSGGHGGKLVLRFLSACSCLLAGPLLLGGPSGDCTFVRGNIVNRSEDTEPVVDLNDGVEIIAFLLLGNDGSIPECLDAADVTPVVDASGLGPGSYSLTPAVSGLPAGVSLVGISPSAVPVTVSAPAEPTPAP